MSPRIVIAVTDLPEPDSPTMANTSPRWTSKDTPSTAGTYAVVGGELGVEVADREEHLAVCLGGVRVT